MIVFGLGAVWAFARPASRAPRRYLACMVFGFWLMATPIGAGLLSWVRAHGYRGIMIWDLDRDVPGTTGHAKGSYVTAISTALGT